MHRNEHESDRWQPKEGRRAWMPVGSGERPGRWTHAFGVTGKTLEGRMKIVAFFLIVISAVGCSGHAPNSTTPGKLSPCPDSPNCVSTKGSAPDHAMPPLPYVGSGRESMDRLIRIIREMKGATIVTAAPSYLHVEFRSALFRFVDDVEFVLDDSARLVHFRSASRTGYYDFGVNRRRMKTISDRYLRDTENK